MSSLLIINPPEWYRRPVVQSAALGIVFCCVFTAYTTLQFYASSTYGELLAANSVSAVYATFTVMCIVAPSITNKFGSQTTMLVGILGYAALVICSLIFFWNNQLDWVVVFGGVILGCGAALLWTGQGRLILDYAEAAEQMVEVEQENTKIHQKKKTTTTSSSSGTILGVFWAVFQCSAIIGGSISFVYYNTKPVGSTWLYIMFLGFILLGAFATQLLLPPDKLVLPNIEAQEDEEQRGHAPTEQTELLSSQEGAQTTIKQIDSQHDGISTDTWVHQAKLTWRLFLSKPMLELSILFFYTGFNQPYQQATFGNRFFTRRTIGVELIIFHLMEIIGAICCGRALDKHNNINENDQINNNTSPVGNQQPVTDAHSTRQSAIHCLRIFVVINSLGNTLAFWHEYENVATVTPVDIADYPQSLLPSVAFACWGFADSQIQVYCYWLLGLIYHKGENHSRAAGFYKCIQSLGTSIGYYIIPTSRLSPMMQLLTSSCVFILGTGLSLLQLPT